LLIVLCVVPSTPAMRGECGVQDGHVQAVIGGDGGWMIAMRFPTLADFQAAREKTLVRPEFIEMVRKVNAAGNRLERQTILTRLDLWRHWTVYRPPSAPQKTNQAYIQFCPFDSRRVRH